MAESIDTRADVQRVAELLRRELQKPKGERNSELIRRSTAVVRAFSESGVQVPEGGAESFQGEVTEPTRFESREGPVDIDPAAQLSNRALGIEAKNRAEDIVNFLKRPFMTDKEKEEKAQELRISRAEEQLQLEADAQASGVDPSSLKPAAIAGGLLPDIAGGSIGGAIPFARSLTGSLARVATEAGLGAVLGGSTTPLDEDPTNAALLDGGITFGLGVMTEIPGLATDFLRREIRAARNSSQDAAIQKISDEIGLDLTIGERTQAPAAIVAETSVAARPDGERAKFLQKRRDQLEQVFTKVEDSLNPSQLSPEQIISRTRDAYDQTISGMARLASEQFRNTIEPTLTKVGAKIDSQGRIQGGFKFIETPELINELQVQRRNLADQPLSGATQQALNQLDNEIARLKASPLDIGQVQRLLKDLSQRNAPTGIVIKDNTQASDILSSKNVQTAITNDLENLIGNPDIPEEFRDAVATMQDARRQFGREMADIEVFKNTAVDRLLGKTGDPTSVDFAQRVAKLDTKGFVDLVDMADDVNPGLGQAIRSVVFKDLVDQHTNLAVLGSNKFKSAEDIEVGPIIGAINKMSSSKRKAFIGHNLDPEQTRFLDNTLVGLKAIAEGPTGKNIHAQTLRNRAEQWAINAASQDKGFIARLLAGELAPGVIERMLFTEQGQRALSNLGQPKITRAQLAQSFTYLNTAMAEDEKAKEELARQRVLKGLADSPI